MDCIAIVVHSSIRLKALINIKSILLNQISGFGESVIRYESHFSTLQMLTPNYVRIIKKQKSVISNKLSGFIRYLSEEI